MATQGQAQSMPSTHDMLQDADKYLMWVVNRPQAVMVRGKGSYVWDAEGKRYLDFIQGWAVNCLGHSPAPVARAIARQARELMNSSPALFNNTMIDTARELVSQTVLDKVFFASSGAEANEGAIKLARKYGAKKLNGAYEIVTTWDGFHGRTLATMAATGKKAWESLFEPKVPGFPKVPFNDLDAMRKAVTPNTCAIMVEPVQGEGGVFVAEPDYMKGLRQLCDEKGILLILDEIQTGMGRCGAMFAYENYGIEPDVMTLGKGIGAGFPVSALLAKDHACVFEGGDQGGTYTFQPLAMVAVQAVVRELVNRNLPKRAATRGRYLQRRLRELRQEFGLTDLRASGLLQAVDLPADKAADVMGEAVKRGLLINAPRPNTLRFMPALTVSNAEIDEGVGILRECLKKVL